MHLCLPVMTPASKSYGGRGTETAKEGEEGNELSSYIPCDLTYGDPFFSHS